jgi:hypothetical protein
MLAIPFARPPAAAGERESGPGRPRWFPGASLPRTVSDKVMRRLLCDRPGWAAGVGGPDHPG